MLRQISLMMATMTSSALAAPSSEESKIIPQVVPLTSPGSLSPASVALLERHARFLTLRVPDDPTQPTRLGAVVVIEATCNASRHSLAENRSFSAACANAVRNVLTRNGVAPRRLPIKLMPVDGMRLPSTMHPRTQAYLRYPGNLVPNEEYLIKICHERPPKYC